MTQIQNIISKFKGNELVQRNILIKKQFLNIYSSVLSTVLARISEDFVEHLNCCLIVRIPLKEDS